MSFTVTVSSPHSFDFGYLFFNYDEPLKEVFSKLLERYQQSLERNFVWILWTFCTLAPNTPLNNLRSAFCGEKSHILWFFAYFPNFWDWEKMLSWKMFEKLEWITWDRDATHRPTPQSVFLYLRIIIKEKLKLSIILLIVTLLILLSKALWDKNAKEKLLRMLHPLYLWIMIENCFGFRILGKCS